jgi:FKBP-type peptidyl-prolyl cis-trans isomerase SlyD
MNPNVVLFHYTLKDKSGKTIESSHNQEPVMFMEGTSQIIPGLETGMKGLKKGDKKQVLVPAAKGYGTHDKTLIMSVPRDQLPQDGEIKVGTQFRSESPEGHARIFTVTAVGNKDITLDGNHPLVDQDLTFDVEIVDVRKATDEEVAHGHAHGPEGHHHH